MWKKVAALKPLKVVDGTITLPDEPGIGLRLDRKAVENYRWTAG